MVKYILFSLIWLPLIAKVHSNGETSPPSPEEIEVELNDAEQELETAKKMFEPYYAGPLLAGSANNVSPGMYNIQPYLYITDTHATYDSNRHVRSIPDILSIRGAFVYQMGLTTWLDFTAIPQGIYNNQKGRNSTFFGDTTLGFGIPLAQETLTLPAFRLVIYETFPSGRYQKLNPKKNGVDATGAGSFQTQIGINLQKIVFWFPVHPIRFRYNFSYTIALPTHVKSFNVYGGGYGTRGKVKPGNTLSSDLGIEYSFSQKWVFALDVVYIDQRKSNFSGKRGRDALGNKAQVGARSNDQLSLAPALQYNPNPNLGFLAGVWFTVRGRNSSDFTSGILTFTYTF